MNMFPVTNTTKLTTQQLIHTCAEQGVAVTVTQLSRWVREGLIPDSLKQRHGLGQGNGTQWLWDAECVPRAVLIGRSLNHDRSLIHAARTLAERGYAPSPDVLREVLIQCVALYQRPMVVRQTYIGSEHPQEEQYRRFRRHMRQKTPDMPDTTFDGFSAYIAALLGLLPDDGSFPETVKQIQQVLSVPSLKERLTMIDGALLLAKYEHAGRVTPTLVPFLVSAFNEFLLPLVKQLQEKRGQDPMVLPAPMDAQTLQEYIQIEGNRVITTNLGIGRLRLYLTIFLAVLPSDEGLLIQWAATLLNIVSGVAEYFGYPPHILMNLFETSRKNDSAQDAPVITF